MSKDAPKPTYSSRNGMNLMPWHIAAGDDGLLRDSILVASMDGNEIVSISLHVATLPAPIEVRRDPAE